MDDLVPIRLEPEWIEARRAEIPELPRAKRERYVADLELPEQHARVLTEDREVASFFERTLEHHPQPKVVANWVMRDLLAVVGDSGGRLEDLPLEPSQLAALLQLVDSGRLTAASAREIFPEVARTGADPEAVMKAQGLEAVSDTGELEGIIREVLAANAGQVEKFRAGEEKLFNFFVGQIMKRTRGKANPALVRDLLGRSLS